MGQKLMLNSLTHMARLHDAIIVVPDTAKLDCLVPNLQDHGLVLEYNTSGLFSCPFQ